MTIPRRLALRFLETHPSEAAALIDTSPELLELLRECDAHLTGELLSGSAPSVAAHVLQELEPADAAAVAEHLVTGSLAAMVRRMEPERAEALSAALPRTTARALRALLEHDEGTAGGLMDPNVLALPRDQSVAEARERLREASHHATYYLYVVGHGQELVGVLTVRDLLLASPDSALSDVMVSPVESLRADARQEAILAHPGWRLYHALPVVDAGGRFLGAVRYETQRLLERTRSGRPGSDEAAALDLAERLWVGLAAVLERIGSARNGAGG